MGRHEGPPDKVTWLTLIGPLAWMAFGLLFLTRRGLFGLPVHWVFCAICVGWGFRELWVWFRARAAWREWSRENPEAAAARRRL